MGTSSCQGSTRKTVASSPKVSMSVAWLARRMRSNFPLLRLPFVAVVIFLSVSKPGRFAMSETMLADRM